MIRMRVDGQNSHHQNPQTRNAGEGVERWKPSNTVGGNVDWHSHCGGSLKSKSELPCDSAIPLLRRLPGWNRDLKGYTHPSAHCSPIAIAKTWKQHKTRIYRGLNRDVKVRMESNSTAKEDERTPLVATWVGLESVIPSEARQRRSGIIRHPVHVESKRSDTN